MMCSAGLLSAVSGHASVIMPPSRNAIDAVEPGTPWSGGKHPPVGSIMPYSSTCTNGTNGVCLNGQSAFWFNQGCTIGCKKCTGNGSRLPNNDLCPGEPKPPRSAMLDPQFRTTNQHTTPGSEQDFWKFYPWRAPGTAPVYDSCGMAGGSPVPGFNAGEYNTTRYAKQGDLGSALPPRPSGTVWRRGATAKARWQQSANHGGGYQYRLCPANEPLTEACFRRTPLALAVGTHTMRHADPSKDKVIDATVVASGGGKGWVRWPYPNYDEGQCDYVVPAGKHCGSGCPGCGPPLYAADGACPCDCDKKYPGLPAGNTDNATFPDPGGGDPNRDFVIEDTLRVPSDIPAGEWVLGWRWDAEMTSQIWTSCSDITII
jgi:hypothetical protein